MIPLRRLIGLICAVLCAGCAVHTTERVRTRVPMDESPAAGEKVVVLVRAVPGHRLLDSEARAAREAVRRVLRQSPGATLVEDAAPSDRRADGKAFHDSWRAAGGDKSAAERLRQARAAASRAADEAAICAARDAGADRACVVELDSA